MRRGSGLAAWAAGVLLLWPVWVLAGERAGGEQPKARGAERGKGALTPEQIAEHQKRMEANLKQQAENLANTAKGFEARCDELKATAAKETLSVSPPLPQFLGAPGSRGGLAYAMRIAGFRRGGEAPPGGPRPGAFDVALSDEVKTAVGKAAEAYGAVLPLLSEQKKALEAQLKQLEGGTPPDPATMRERMAADSELRMKTNKAQGAVGDAEADLQLLLAKAWLGAAKEKATSDEAKAGAGKALEALGKYRELKTQLDKLEQELDQQATALQEGLNQVRPGLVQPGRGGPGGPGGGERRERPAPKKDGPR